MENFFNRSHSKIIYIMELTDLKDRIRVALKEANISQHELARKCKITHATVSQWLAGNVKTIRSDTALKVSQVLKVDLTWLLTGKGNKNPQFVNVAALQNTENTSPLVDVPLYIISSSYKENRRVFMFQQVSNDKDPFVIQINEKWFLSKDINPSNCVFIKTPSDTMLPSIGLEDYVLIDRSSIEIKNNGIYLLSSDYLDLALYRVSRQLSGDILVSADNPNYQSVTLSESMMLKINFQVIGKAVFKIGAL